jgi:hypothetical protein
LLLLLAPLLLLLARSAMILEGDCSFFAAAGMTSSMIST